ncbi:MAG: polysaccharide deacetylase family protein [Chitinophagaceae bacterium]|nr:polysaccharide deacetylase family protein [Chitinophagaceae bacterium]
MRKYFIKTPWIIKRLFPKYIWSIPSTEKNVYLTFDDGPHPTITPFVLDQLKKINAEATFFCIGKNVQQYENVFQHMISEGHAIGNHTQNHLNGWKTSTDEYLNDVASAAKIIQSNLFRPPYGKIKMDQVRKLSLIIPKPRIIMWDVLSGDFDERILPYRCMQNILRNVTAGSIVVFHDSEKAQKNLEYVLPLVLKELINRDYSFKKIE